MIANQYTIKLPADYDMEIIRRRVADTGHRFDDWPGLAFKAFLISERSAGATANRYAPFYLWNNTDGLNEFLYGPGFAGLSGSFGRPRLSTGWRSPPPPYQASRLTRRPGSTARFPTATFNSSETPSKPGSGRPRTTSTDCTPLSSRSTPTAGARFASPYGPPHPTSLAWTMSTTKSSTYQSQTAR